MRIFEEKKPLMLSKLFSFGHRKSGKKHVDGEAETNEIYGKKRPFPQLEQDEIRVLVFRDCDRKGKTLLFDSKAAARDHRQQDGVQNKGNDVDLKRLSGGPKLDPKQGSKSPTTKHKLQHPRPSHDATMLGEMIFGSVAMTYKGQTVKVHEIRTPHQLLLTNVFALKPRIVMPNCCDGNEYLSTSSQVDSVIDDSTRIDLECASLSSQNSFSKGETGLNGISSKPMDVPGSSPILVIDADGDSGIIASVESSYMDENLSSHLTSASSPCGSYHRRLYRSHATSIDRSFGRKSEELSDDASPVMRRRPKLGIGVILSLGDNEEKSRALQGFFFAHFPLFESHINRLRLAIENACFVRTRSFSGQVMEAVTEFQEHIHNLLAAPRLKEPVWLNMMTQSAQRPQMCEKFMIQLIDCLKLGNTRETNFFMASVLTAVLQYHLAWVSTVMPAGTAPCRAFLDKHSSKTLDLLAQSHPYNPLWAQLGDLYGAVGYPLRVAKTVVVGKDSKLVEQVINILSYFIRCTEVFEHVQRRGDANVKDNVLNYVSSVGEESISSQCENKPLDEVEKSEKTCSLTSETEMCLKCKQKCLRQCELDDTQDKDNLCGDVLKQLHVNGMTHCSKCGPTSNSSLEKLRGVEMLQSHGTYGGIKKELKHFMKDKNHSNQSFRCYCCNDVMELHSMLSQEMTHKCICDSGSDSSNTLGKEDSIKQLIQTGKIDHCLSCLSKRLMAEHSMADHQSPTNGCLTKLVKSVQSKDSLTPSNGHTDNRISETDSCLSDDLDTVSVQSSLPGRRSDLGETISCYGRSGSADSGIHQTPLNSPSALHPEDFLRVADLLGEESQLPEEIPLPDTVDVNCCPDLNSTFDEWRNFNNFGRSLFAGICDRYLPDFVLQGVPDNGFKESLSTDLKLALQHSVVDDPVSEAVCIIANTDKWTCNLVSVKKNRKHQSGDPVHVQKVEVSNLVFSMLSSLRGLWDLKMSAEFCLMHLEDKLKEIYLKSKVLTERLRDKKRALTRDELTKMLSVDESDVPLLLSVAGTHTPNNVSLGS